MGPSVFPSHQEGFLVELNRAPPGVAAKYRDFSKAKLLRGLVKREAAVKKLRNKIRFRFAKKLPAAAQSSAALEIQRMSGRRQSPFSVRSFLAVGVRRNLSNVSSHDFQHVAVQRVSRWTVNRAETVAAAALVASHRLRMQEVGNARALSAMDIARAEDSSWIISMSGDDLLRRPTYDSLANLKFSCVSYRGDATNAGCWRGNKLHATFVELLWAGICLDLKPAA